MEGISVIAVIRFIAAADTSRFKRVEDRERINIYRHILAGLDFSSEVIIVIMWATRQKKGVLIYKLY